MIDLRFRGRPGLIASFLLPLDEGWAMVETGPARSRPALLEGLATAGIDPGEIRQVFVTHIHLDHAGGVGAIQRDLPRATFFVHEAGLPHLVDPARLDASARRAWGPIYDEALGGLTPIPSDRLIPLRGGERFPLSGGVLEVVATPGHARHHLSFFDTRSRAMLTGDSAGVRVAGSPQARPAVPPPDLDVEALLASVDRMASFHPAALW
ncbi:MAG: MBL fold metallo-hydrolase, partial [Thermoplasmata archaeon]